MDKKPESESPWTEITIQPDGRVYIFGMSRTVLEVLSNLPSKEPTLSRLVEQLQRLELMKEKSLTTTPGENS